MKLRKHAKGFFSSHKKMSSYGFSISLGYSTNFYTANNDGFFIIGSGNIIVDNAVGTAYLKELKKLKIRPPSFSPLVIKVVDGISFEDFLYELFEYVRKTLKGVIEILESSKIPASSKEYIYNIIKWQRVCGFKLSKNKLKVTWFNVVQPINKDLFLIHKHDSPNGLETPVLVGNGEIIVSNPLGNSLYDGKNRHRASKFKKSQSKINANKLVKPLKIKVEGELTYYQFYKRLVEYSEEIALEVMRLDEKSSGPYIGEQEYMHTKLSSLSAPVEPSNIKFKGNKLTLSRSPVQEFDRYFGACNFIDSTERIMDINKGFPVARDYPMENFYEHRGDDQGGVDLGDNYWEWIGGNVGLNVMRCIRELLKNDNFSFVGMADMGKVLRNSDAETYLNDNPLYGTSVATLRKRLDNDNLLSSSVLEVPLLVPYNREVWNHGEKIRINIVLRYTTNRGEVNRTTLVELGTGATLFTVLDLYKLILKELNSVKKCTFPANNMYTKYYIEEIRPANKKLSADNLGEINVELVGHLINKDGSKMKVENKFIVIG